MAEKQITRNGDIVTDKKRIVIWGASGFARKVADIVCSGGGYEVVGFLDDVSPERKGAKFCGRTVLGGKEELPALLSDGVGELAFGFGACHARVESSRYAVELGFNLPSITHASAIVADDAQMGAGTLVGAGAVLEANTRVGNYAFINTGSTIAHDVVIGDGTHICPGVTVCGCTAIGAICWVGAGSTVIDQIKIGSGTFVGAGSLIIRDLPDNVVAWGSPARVVRESDGQF